jgi:hypothetical protein
MGLVVPNHVYGREPDRFGGGESQMVTVVVRRTNDRGHEQVIVREFENHRKASFYRIWQKLIAELLGEVIHVR